MTRNRRSVTRSAPAAPTASSSSPRTAYVKPRPGIILAGIPASGADVPLELAAEWIANGLVVAAKREA